MRVTTAFNRVLALPGTCVTSVEFTEEGVVIGVRARARRHRCPCGRPVRGRYDTSVRRWRHVNWGATRMWLQATIARVSCPACRRVRTEDVPWARPGARHSRDFDQVVAWLAQRMDKTSVARLMGCSWTTVDRCVDRLVDDHLDDARLDGLYRIGVDEISYRRGHKYLTVVADQDTGRVVWVSKERTTESFAAFFAALGPERCAQLEAVTCDAARFYRPVIEQWAPNARICLDPFHIVKWTNEALDSTYRAAPTLTEPTPSATKTRFWQRVRTALRTGHEKLSDEQTALLALVRKLQTPLFRAWQLKEGLRDLYRNVEPQDAAKHLTEWIRKASASSFPAFRALAQRLDKHFDRIVASVELDLSNGLLEGINSKIRVIQRRGYGHRDPESLMNMIHLCLGKMQIVLPTRT